MEKHAYLIMAHHQFELLEILLECIDDERNDIFLHIDKKAGRVDKNRFEKKVKRSNIYFLKQMSIKWGSYWQVECELMALNTALKNGIKNKVDYLYFHWLSGTDLPIKNQKEIHNFFRCNPNCEFIHFDSREIKDSFRERLKYWQFLRKAPDSKAHFGEYCEILQKKLGIDRLYGKNIIIQKGSAFWTITKEMAEWILSHEREIHKLFYRSLCGDELFMQTVLVNSPRINNLYWKEYNNDLVHSSLRYIDWQADENSANPKILTIDDYSTLMQSDALFARKFDIYSSPEIIYMVRDAVLGTVH